MRRYDLNVDAGNILSGDKYEKIRAVVGEVIFGTEDPRDIPDAIRWLGTKFGEQGALNEIARMACDMQYEMPRADDDIDS